jgi:biopolymer transport protein TolQ
VLILLLIFSIYSWAIIITKLRWLKDAEKETKQFLARFQRGGKLSELYQAADADARSPLVRVFMAGYDEINNQIGEAAGQVRSLDSLGRVLQSATISEVSQMEKRLTWLATTANASPFIGLFGTVVGINPMNGEADCSGRWSGSSLRFRDSAALRYRRFRQ